MECHKWSGQNVSDFYQEASTCSEVSTFQRIQMKIGETVLTRFVSVFLLVRMRDRSLTVCSEIVILLAGKQKLK